MKLVLKLSKQNSIETPLYLNRINGGKKLTVRRKKKESFECSICFLTKYTVRRLGSFKRPRVTHKIARGCSFSSGTIIRTSYQISSNSSKKGKKLRKTQYNIIRPSGTRGKIKRDICLMRLFFTTELLI